LDNGGQHFCPARMRHLAGMEIVLPETVLRAGRAKRLAF
jgi:hypothetical protein